MTAAAMTAAAAAGGITTVRAPGTRTWGPTADAVMAALGRPLLPWQSNVVAQLLEVDGSGRLTRHDAGLIVPRRNGKTEAVIFARILAGVLVGGERHVLFTAHEAETANQAWARLGDLVAHPFLAGDLAPVMRRGRGSESIELRGIGARIDFRTRTAHGGRGRETDLLVLDEALRLHDDQVAALLPLLAAARSRGRGQVIVASSAGREDALPLLRFAERGRALAGTSGDGMAYHEFAAARGCDLDDRAVWAQANPSLGSDFLTVDAVASIRAAMDDETFGREHLGWWPRTDAAAIAPGLWAAAVDAAPLDPAWPAVLAVELSPDRVDAAVVLAARDPAGVRHLRLLHVASAGQAWQSVDAHQLAATTEQLWRATGAAGVTGDPWTAAPVLDLLDARKVPVRPAKGPALALATAGLIAGVTDRRIRHDDDGLLTGQVLAAGTRPSRDGGLVLSRRFSAGPIAAAVAAALAAHAADGVPPPAAAHVYVAR